MGAICFPILHQHGLKTYFLLIIPLRYIEERLWGAEYEGKTAMSILKARNFIALYSLHIITTVAVPVILFVLGLIGSIQPRLT
jgi:hypothetical protein